MIPVDASLKANKSMVVNFLDIANYHRNRFHHDIMDLRRKFISTIKKHPVILPSIINMSIELIKHGQRQPEVHEIADALKSILTIIPQYNEKVRNEFRSKNISPSILGDFFQNDFDMHTDISWSRNNSPQFGTPNSLILVSNHAKKALEIKQSDTLVTMDRNCKLNNYLNNNPAQAECVIDLFIKRLYDFNSKITQNGIIEETLIDVAGNTPSLAILIEKKLKRMQSSMVDEIIYVPLRKTEYGLISSSAAARNILYFIKQEGLATPQKPNKKIYGGALFKLET